MAARHLRDDTGNLNLLLAEPIAIIGMSCRFSGGADSVEKFWDLLRGGRDAVSEVPRDRFDVDAWYDPNSDRPGKIATRWGGFLNSIDKFDADFFGISRLEAQTMDPQQRLWLEVAWEALEDAGQRAEDLAGSRTGVFTGVSNIDYAWLPGNDAERLNVYSGTGTASNIVAGRLAYLFDLRGPAMALDTACSSALVAVQMACQHLRTTECDLAVAGGVNLILSPRSWLGMSRMGMLAPDGRCKVFDARANGMVRAEGCGAVVLKRLSDALSDGDPVWAVIRGVAVNQDGRSAGLTAPNILAQQNVLRRALENGGVDAASVGYIETHGTGTSLGDPIEVEALTDVYGGAPGGTCVLGAVKSNIGHAEAAAGVAGLIKAVLALHHHEIPRNLHFEQLNPNISLEGTRFELANRAVPWPEGAVPRYAAVSSFGWSGTNAHVVVEEAPARMARKASLGRWLLPFSARSEAALREMAGAWRQFLLREDTPSVEDLCYTAALRRTQHPHRAVVAGATHRELAESLAAFLSGIPLDIGDARVAEGECVRLPGYAWQRERYWLEDVENPFEWGEEEVAGHRVEGAAVLAGSGYVQLAAEAVGSAAIAVEGMEWKRLLSVKERRRVKVSLRGDRFAVYSEEAGEWVEHGGGRVTKLGAKGPTGDRDAIEAARRRCGEHIGAEAWYRAMAGKGLEYGGAHRGVEEAWLGDGEAVARVDGKRSLTGLLDSCFQVLGELPGKQSGLRVPVRADRIAVYGEVQGDLWVWARAAGGEIDVIDASGRTVIEVRGLELRALDSKVRDEIGSWLYRWQWRPQRVPGRGATGMWAVLGDGGIKTGLCAALEAVGAEVSEAASGTCRGIVALWGLEGEAGWEPVLQLVQELAQRGGREMPRLWLATRGLAGSLLWGLGRTVMYEHPELRCTVVEIGEGASAAELAAEVLADSAEDQVMLRAGERYVGRLTPGGSGTEPVLQEAGAEAFAAEMVQPGQLRGAGLRMKPRKRPGPGEVEVEVMAAGVNFLDVLTALGERLGEEMPEMGSEFAGRIVGVGEGIEEWKSGDEVVGCAPGSWGTHVCVRGESVARKPAGMSFEEAAALPVVYATAWYSLRQRARLQAGERVLIHSAAGATGLAMVQVARSLGAEVLATAGTEEKRAYLRRLGIEQVMDSRTVKFAEQVRDVDVVVNGLTGESVKASLAVLRRHGRLVELGKREIYGGGRLELGSFRKGLTYHAVDLLGMQREVPGEFGKLLREVMGAIERGELRRGPVQVLGIEAAGEALERLAGGKQIGKLVLSLRERERVKVEGHRGVREEGVYLITGGMGGIGLRVAEWLVERGARQLVLAGREIRGGTAVERMREQGAEVWVRQVDVACGEQVEALVEEIDGKLGRLRGVVHAAGVLDDGVLARMSTDQFRGVLGAKVEGAKHLDRVTRGKKLDWFVMFSSVASVLGSPGQGNYAAGNAYLDALAGERRLRGEVGQSINWGPWSGVGLAAAQENRGVRLTDRGIGSMTPEQGLEALGRVLESGWEQVVVMPFDLRQWRQYYPKRGTAASFAEIPQRGRSAGGEVSALRSELAAAEPARRQQLLEQHLRHQVAQVLRLNKDQVQEDMPLGRIGFDSLSALELRNRLEAALTLELPGTLIWRHPTIRSVAAYLLERLGLSTPATPVVAATAATVAASNSAEVRRHVDQLSDEEVRLALRQRRPLNR